MVVNGFKQLKTVDTVISGWKQWQMVSNGEILLKIIKKVEHGWKLC